MGLAVDAVFSLVVLQVELATFAVLPSIHAEAAARADIDAHDVAILGSGLAELDIAAAARFDALASFLHGHRPAMLVTIEKSDLYAIVNRQDGLDGDDEGQAHGGSEHDLVNFPKLLWLHMSLSAQLCSRQFFQGLTPMT